MRAFLTFALLIAFLLDGALGGTFISYPYAGRKNMLFIPSNTSSPRPLYVMLHGCTQDPTDFSKGTKMNTYADQFDFFVLYPEQPSSANQNKCWNWFEPADQSRGSGEPKIISDMTKDVASEYNVDATQIFVGGLSAGAAMSVIVGVTYPDVFRASAVGAGLEYEAATSMIGAFTAMASGGPDPTGQAKVAYQASNGNARPLPTLVIHGNSDYTVNFVNGQQVTTMATVYNSLCLGGNAVPDEPSFTKNGQVPGGRSYSIQYYQDINTGQVMVMFVIVQGMGHAWSGGSSSGTYTDPSGPDASLIMIEFFSNFSSSTTTGQISTSGGGATTTTTTGGTGSSTGSVTSTTSASSSSTTGSPAVTLTAISGETGWAGQYLVDQSGTDTVKVGSKGMFNTDTYRGIIPFSTANAPSSISAAVLNLRRKSMTGDVSQIFIDAKGGELDGSDDVQQGDYGASVDLTNLASFTPPASDDDWVSIPLPSSILPLIKEGRVVFRLRGTNTPEFSADTVFFYGGDGDAPSSFPTLALFY